MRYTVRLTRQARKDIISLPAKIQAWAVSTIDQLAENPRPIGCKQLKGGVGYSIRRSDYRIVYEIHDEMLVVVVVRAAHRREVYRDR
jgi:mRNA interferase RelE/StbE